MAADGNACAACGGDDVVATGSIGDQGGAVGQAEVEALSGGGVGVLEGDQGAGAAVDGGLGGEVGVRGRVGIDGSAGRRGGTCGIDRCGSGHRHRRAVRGRHAHPPFSADRGGHGDEPSVRRNDLAFGAVGGNVGGTGGALHCGHDLVRRADGGSAAGSESRGCGSGYQCGGEQCGMN